MLLILPAFLLPTLIQTPTWQLTCLQTQATLLLVTCQSQATSLWATWSWLAALTVMCLLILLHRIRPRLQYSTVIRQWDCPLVPAHNIQLQTLQGILDTTYQYQQLSFTMAATGFLSPIPSAINRSHPTEPVPVLH